MGKVLTMEDAKIGHDILEDAIIARRGKRKAWQIAKGAIGMGMGLCATVAATYVLSPLVTATLPQTSSAIGAKVIKATAVVGTGGITGMLGAKVYEDVDETLESVEYLYDVARLAMEARHAEASSKMESLHRKYTTVEEG